MTKLANFHPGEAVHCYLSSVASSSGAIVDLTAIKFAYWPPTTAGASVCTSSGSGFTSGSSGNYYYEVTPTTAQVGLWHYRWSSTGTYALTQWGSFRVIDPPRST